MLTVTQAFCESRAAQLRFQAQTGYVYNYEICRQENEQQRSSFGFIFQIFLLFAMIM